MRFGFFFQGQYEAAGAVASDRYTQNLFVRHVALLLGGSVANRFDYFLETDFADLFKAPSGPDSLKNGPGITVTDAFVTFHALDDRIVLDAGLMLPPGVRNSLQSKATLLSWDYFLNASRQSAAFGSTNNAYGRDAGVQLRGLGFDGLLEYRAGIFQGKRNLPDPDSTPVASRNPFRVAARLQLNLLAPEKAYFYTGTALGRESHLSIGVAVDYQRDGNREYRAFAADVFLDVASVTAQLDVVYRDGGALVAIDAQKAVMAEAGYRVDPLKLSPVVRFERRWQSRDAGNESDFAAGLVYWAFDHTSNVKAFYVRLLPERGAYNQVDVTWQLFFY